MLQLLGVQRDELVFLSEMDAIFKETGSITVFNKELDKLTGRTKVKRPKK